MASSLNSTLPSILSCRRLIAGLAVALFVSALGGTTLRAQLVAWSVSVPLPSQGSKIYFDPRTGNTATDPDGTSYDESFGFYIFNSTWEAGTQTLVYGTNGKGPNGESNGVIYDFTEAVNLSYGATVSSANQYWAGANVASMFYSPTYFGSNFAAGTTGYIGLRFFEGDQTYYGWASIVREVDSTLVTLTGFGYNSTPGEAALAGVAPVAVPEPATWGALVGGAALAVAALRRRKLVGAQ